MPKQSQTRMLGANMYVQHMLRKKDVYSFWMLSVHLSLKCSHWWDSAGSDFNAHSMTLMKECKPVFKNHSS